MPLTTLSFVNDLAIAFFFLLAIGFIAAARSSTSQPEVVAIPVKVSDNR